MWQPEVLPWAEPLFHVEYYDAVDVNAAALLDCVYWEGKMKMKIGWVGFSNSERNKVVSILRLLESQTALDELGVGTVRDAFSNLLFPGISTLETRAKYFVLVPYIFNLAERQRFRNRRDVLQFIQGQESKMVETLVKNSAPSADGIIGSRNFKQGRTVKMKPSTIYWSGLRATSILRYPELNIANACAIIYGKTQKRQEITLKTEDSDSAGDDADTLLGGQVLFTPIVPDYDLNDATIELTGKEATYLLEQFIASPGTEDSLTAYMLRNRVSYSSFEAIDPAEIPGNLGNIIMLGQDFANFIYGAHLLYNIIYAEGSDYQDALTEEIHDEFYSWLDHYTIPKLDEIIALSLCPNSTASFLHAFDEAAQTGDVSTMRELIIQREKFVKPNRMKLNHPEQYRYDRPIHYYKMNYRFSIANTIINDIFRGLGAI